MDSESVGWRNWQLSASMSLTEECEETEVVSSTVSSPELPVELKSVVKVI
ncbi:hypothetical protein DICVIV_03331 [Dictyocaulus viviparus]|uniref:Uncharacterized protein n=1 Tax=Dictyocaulus viviparus TaxID=29172 RepID=A0A0D8Y7B1_DICVI|nr:hypothetical protein DICVIV_03331 [Dictyocaulus viviparus]